MGHLPQSQLKELLIQAADQVNVGARYYHYKSQDHYYLVKELVIIEEIDEVGVVYQLQHDEMITFMRPLASWIQWVDHDGQSVPRFQDVDHRPATP